MGNRPACHVAFDASVPFPRPGETAGERRCSGCGKLRGIQSATRPLFADWCCGRGSYNGKAELPPNPRRRGERSYPDEDAVCKPTKACKPTIATDDDGGGGKGGDDGNKDGGKGGDDDVN